MDDLSDAGLLGRGDNVACLPLLDTGIGRLMPSSFYGEDDVVSRA